MNKLHSDDINPVYNIILAGGKSTRLEARVSDIDAKKPKFLIVNYGDQPLLECTVKRNMKFSHKQVIVTNTDYYELIKKSISKRLLPAKNNTCFEEENLGTAYAIFNGINFISDLAKIHVKKKKKVLNIDPIIIVTPSDHVIEDQAAYQYSITKTIQLACAFNCLYVLGIPPEYPTTEYGYFTITPICENTTNGSVKSFIEKPSSKKVMELCSISSCYWNSGIFIGKFSIFKKLFANYPLNDTKTSSAVENGNGSFDQDILEKAVKDHPDWIRGIKAHFDWIDIGVPDTLEQCLIDERCKLKPIKE